MVKNLKKLIFILLDLINVYVFYPRCPAENLRVLNSPLFIFKMGFIQKVIGINRSVRWPIHFTSYAKGTDKVDIGSRLPGLSMGCYLDGRNGIQFGKGVRVGPRVSLISQNHDTLNLDDYVQTSPIKIGDYVWLATGVIILAGVELGPHTVVGAGSVVTKSFPEGHVILAGNPAKPIRKL